MSLGTVYHRNTGRETGLRAIAQALDVDVKFSEPEADFNKKFPLGKVPAFESADGKYLLHETAAIALYLALKSKTPEAAGTNAEEKAAAAKWTYFSQGELIDALVNAIFPLLGNEKFPYNKKKVEDNTKLCNKYADVFEAYLTKNTFLVNERITIADYVVASVFAFGFGYIWDKAWIKQHPAVTRFFNTVIASKGYSGIIPSPFPFKEEAIKYTPPKKEPKKKAEEPKKAEKPAADAEEPPKEKKAAHPLASLPAPKMALDEWKRVYSNKETREEALPWFWEHYDPSEYSLYKVAYKYNDELKLTFMSNNLVGGFFNRLSASTKYLFGCLVVYGENNNNGIEGVFLVRGQDYEPAFDVAPDWESYEFTKLDASKPEDKEYVEDMWSWDKPVIVNGEKREIADGKVFK